MLTQKGKMAQNGRRRQLRATRDDKGTGRQGDMGIRGTEDQKIRESMKTRGQGDKEKQRKRKF